MIYQISGSLTEFKRVFYEYIKEDNHPTRAFLFFGHLSRTTNSGFYGVLNNNRLCISIIDMTRFNSYSPYAFIGHLEMDSDGLKLKGKYRLTNKIIAWMTFCSLVMLLAILTTGTLTFHVDYIIGILISSSCFLLLWVFFIMMRLVVYKRDFNRIQKLLVEDLLCKKIAH